MDKITEQISRKRMHGLYLSRKCEDIVQLSHELLGLHCWFHRNAAFSALIRGTDLNDWKTALTKTWVHHALHGVVFDELPRLLALHSSESPGEASFGWLGLNEEQFADLTEKITALMEDGVYSRAEMRRIFARDYNEETIRRVFSPWGGIFVVLANQGKVAFRDMTSRNFDLISAEPTQTRDEVLPEMLRRYFAVYGPATLADAAWFFGLWKENKKKLSELDLDEFSRIEYDGNTYYYVQKGNIIQVIVMKYTQQLHILSWFLAGKNTW